MTFAANNGVGMAGSAAADSSNGTEPCRWPIGHTGNRVSTASHQFRSQWPVFSLPGQRTLENKPASQPGSATPGERIRKWKWPSWLRPTVPSKEEQRGPAAGPLTGSLFDYGGDPGQLGTMIELAHNEPVGAREMGDLRNLQRNFDVEDAPQPAADSPSGMNTSDTTELVQGYDTYEHETLKAVRASFPGISVQPLPQTTSIVLTATNQAAEITLPDSAVLARITWSGMYAGADLLVSTTGIIVAPTTAQPNNAQAYDGVILNPDPGTLYFVKGKQALSVMVPAATLQFVNPTVVNVQAYLQA